MQAFSLHEFTTIEFPEPARSYHRAGRSAALVRELGDSYEKYHSFLAEELARFGRRPEREDFADVDGYLSAWTRIHELVLAEALLRVCYEHRRKGRRLDAPLELDLPLISEERGLLSLAEARRLAEG